MEDGKLASAAQDLAAFSMLLVRHLGGHHHHREEDEEETTPAARPTNMAFSPMSLHAILSLLAAGATGAVREQIVSFLGPAGEHAHEALASKAISSVLSTRGNDDDVGEVDDEDDEEAPTPPPEVRCTMGIWVESSSLVLKPAFAAMAGSKYSAEARAVSFRKNTAQARAEINEWFNSKTGGHVQSLPLTESISASTLVVLANALYFRGYWYDYFLPEMTRDGSFHISPGREVTVPFMEGNDLHARMQIGCHPGFKVLRMPYAAGMCQYDQKFSMYIYLPDDRDGLPGMVRELSSNPVAFLHGDDVVPARRVLVGELRLPTFQVSHNAEFSRLLADLGLDLTLFRPAGDSFSEMVAPLAEAEDDDDAMLPPMGVPSIVHQCSVQINESGTVAVAATALEIIGFSAMDAAPEPVVDFVADHPFLFFIKEDRSRLLVFAGQVVDPS
ncbi:hypothetical protein HU200_049386 [Digitaria exilis]|uniref:Serpin domain-containing protein n=1 Tax=Digitaria exilis TaxID=1010633 RepID=A0A835AWE1_9POAL|nr:hypothetical protein HU200_049386 [Digitaria exilis]